MAGKEDGRPGFAFRKTNASARRSCDQPWKPLYAIAHFLISPPRSSAPTMPRARSLRSPVIGVEEMIRKLVEMQSKTPLTIPTTNLHHDSVEIPLAESKGNEIGREKFDEESSFHQEPPSRVSLRGVIGFLERGTQEGSFMEDMAG
ncbi:hypothetical protein M5K25_010088 [Dendrobium thyrsiflorum]|uniref:Uncharacterized protein n=1 Tax=Dendrobium thyrsiflorum TaxID=117978 RepID=A0ABD0UZW6_DENTH